MGPKPTRDGWRAITETPSLILCEIAWRWTFGVALCAVAGYIAFASLGHVQITDSEMRLIRALDPRASAYVLLRVVNAIAPAVVRVFSYVLPALIVLWVAAATVGRAATLKALLGDKCGRIHWLSLASINVLRVVVLFAAVLAFIGSSILVGRFFHGQQDLFGFAVLLGLGLNLLVLSIWSLLNWFLTLAPIFVMHDGAGTFGSVTASLELFRQQSRPYVGTAFLLGLVRLGVIIVASFLSLLPLGMVGGATVGGILVVGIAVTLIYFALIDVVQIWRIAAYTSLAQYEPEIPVPDVPAQPLPIIPPYSTEPPPLPDSGEPESSF